MSKPNQPFYEFGEFQLDPTERILFHHGAHVHLQPKTFETLLALIEQSGHVVRKEELMERVWPDAFVEEINLTKNISTLRKTLRNGYDAGEFIETIPTVGYRFVVAVRQSANGDVALEVPASATPAEEENLAVPPAPRRQFAVSPRRQWLWYGLALLLVVGVSLAWWLPQRKQRLPAVDEFAPVRLTNHLAIDQYPAYSPDGKKIAFQSNRDGLPTIYVMNADGSNVQKLVHDLPECLAPNWSADGTKIYFWAKDAAYGVNADGSNLTKLPTLFGTLSPDGQKTVMVKPLVAGSQASAEIFVADVDGSHPLRLTNNQLFDSDPSWSLDGRRIAFTSFPDGFVEGGNNNAEICVMNADGSNLVRLTSHPAWDNGPIWSPDGTRIVFQSTRNCQTGNALHVMNADGSNVLPLTGCRNSAGGTGSWSPDKKTIIYASDQDGNVEVYAINSDPSRQTNLTQHPAEDLAPAWSRDGKQIAFVSNRDGKDSLFVMQADGGHPHKLVSNTGQQVSWSPDGRKLAFGAAWQGNLDVYVANADGSNVRQLTHSPAHESEPVWSPDGAKLLFNYNDGGAIQIYVMNTDGSGVTRISHSAEHEWQQDWSPDGQQIVFTRSRHRGVQRDIWLMNADGSNPRLLVSAPGNDELLFPCFSPDGQRIAFHRRVASPLQTDVWMMNADGSRQTRLTYLGGGVPAWSPDGKKLAFQSQKRTGNNEIYAMQVK